MALAGSFASAQTTIIGTDFTGRVNNANSVSNITWTGADATSSASTLQAIRIDNNGHQVRGIIASTPDNAGYFTVSSGNGAESWIIDVPFTVTASVAASSLTIQWAGDSTSNLASPGFGFALYSTPAADSNLNLVPFGGGSDALGYAITGTVQPSGMGNLSSAMTGNVTPVNASNLADPQSITLSLGSPVELTEGSSYVLRVAVFENDSTSPSYNQNIFLDSVNLNSYSAVPEPSTYAGIMGLSALVFAGFRHRRGYRA